MSSSHFQYEGKENNKSYGTNLLFQGDILERTTELAEILKELYPYVHQNPEKYPYFVVLTQSCDLMPHGGQTCKAEHITICAARPIRFFLEQEISKLQNPVFKKAGICLKTDKPEFLHKIERLLSNEEYPYFYLHPAAETPFAEPHVAYLRITFPLRSDSHYKICLKAKRAQLAPVFQAKLGWLTTLVFGRVATEDFSPEERKEQANVHIDSIPGIVWRKRNALLNEARRKGLCESLSKLSPEQLQELIDAVDLKSQPETFADLIVEHAQVIWSGRKAEFEKFRMRLLKDPSFTALIGD